VFNKAADEIIAVHADHHAYRYVKFFNQSFNLNDSGALISSKLIPPNGAIAFNK
jgi:hypothetical protein